MSKRILFLRIFFYSLFVVVIWFYIRYIERRNIFFPSKQIETTPKDFGLSYEDVNFITKDGIRLNGWFIPGDGLRWTVLFCHGNAGNISHRIDIARLFNKAGINIFLFDYRGYGRSEGRPSERGLYIDALSAYDYLCNRRDVDNDKIIVFGESLGGAVATEVARKRAISALICESTFTSTVDMAKRVYPILPGWLLVTQHFDSISKIKDVDAPVLIMHSKDDEIVPFEFGWRLYQAASEPKQFYIMKGGHNEAKLIDQEGFIGEIINFLHKHLDKGGRWRG